MDNATDRSAVPQNVRLARPALAIFLVSVLVLFLEMLLIRWIGTEIRIFAYLQNTILIVCFLGLGLGAFTCERPITLRQTLVPLTFLVGLLAVPATREALANVTQSLRLLDDLVTWGADVKASAFGTVALVMLGLATSYVVMILIADTFVPLGRILGRFMNLDPRPIRAYSANIAGSLVGTWLFVLLSAWYQPPSTWFLVVSLLVLGIGFWVPSDRRLTVALLVAIVPLAWLAGRVPGTLSLVWSPYQKLEMRVPNHEAGEIGDYLVTVNGTGYQMMADLSTAQIAAHPERYPAEFHGISQYDLPLLLHPNPAKYLVVGAGSGNDVAGGLRHGAGEIVAVEIDPAIIALGRQYHPEHPYQSPIVKVVNNDARSFFATTRERFDIITFGLLDSHTTTAMTNARLDSYVYTRESLDQAKSLLTEHGIVVLSFEAQRPFIADRMARVLAEVFGTKPLAFRIPPTTYGWGGAIFVAGDLAAARSAIAANPMLAAFIEQMRGANPLPLSYTTKVTTDDWPYTYLESPKVPVLYYLLAALMVAVGFRGFRQAGATGLAGRWTSTHWHFFFLGAAFLLLEVQNISKASVVLGNTWDVNAVIASGVLLMALAANWLASRFPNGNVTGVYVALIGLCIGLFFVDLGRFAFLPYPIKVVAVGVLTTCPMLFSGIVFVRSFVRADSKSEALAANLVGALVGALLQSLTFVVGIRALLLVVGALYACSFVSLPDRRLRQSA